MIKKIMNCLVVMMTMPFFASVNERGSVLVLSQPRILKSRSVSFAEDLDAKFQSANISPDGSDKGDSGRSSTTECAIVLLVHEEEQKLKEAHGTKTPSGKGAELEDCYLNTPSPKKTSLYRALSLGSTNSLFDCQLQTPSPKKTPSPKNTRKLHFSDSSSSLVSKSLGSFRFSNNENDCIIHTPSEKGNSSPEERKLLFPSGPSASSLSDEFIPAIIVQKLKDVANQG